MKKLTKVVCLVAVCCCFCLVACGQKGSKGQPKNKSVAFTKDVAGIDVSRYQGNVNWEKVKKTLPKGSFVYVKCTEGATYIDPKCKTLAKGAKASGYRVGGYHFFRMSSSAHEQFRHFKKILDAIGPNLIPMVDVELDVDLKGASQKKDSSCAGQFAGFAQSSRKNVWCEANDLWHATLIQHLLCASVQPLYALHRSIWEK